MKKIYMTPETEVLEYMVDCQILAGSDLSGTLDGEDEDFDFEGTDTDGILNPE